MKTYIPNDTNYINKNWYLSTGGVDVFYGITISRNPLNKLVYPDPLNLNKLKFWFYNAFKEFFFDYKPVVRIDAKSYQVFTLGKHSEITIETEVNELGETYLYIRYFNFGRKFIRMYRSNEVTQLNDKVSEIQSEYVSFVIARYEHDRALNEANKEWEKRKRIVSTSKVTCS
jgi:hypothetical protein